MHFLYEFKADSEILLPSFSSPASSNGGDTIKEHYTIFSCFAGDASIMENCVQKSIK